MEILGKIFGSEAKVRILRLFLFNEGRLYDTAEAAKRANAKEGEAKKEIAAASKSLAGELDPLIKQLDHKKNKLYNYLTNSIQ